MSDELIKRLQLAGRHPDFAICMEAAARIADLEATDKQIAGFDRCFEALGISDDRERSWSSLVLAINDVVERLAALESAENEAVPVAWMTRGSQILLANGGNCKGTVPVHGKPSATAKIALYTHSGPASKDAIRREALEAIANQDPVEMALDPTWAKRIASAALSQKVGDQQ